jgi:hypothetical protein
VGRETPAIVIIHASYQAKIQPAHQHALTRQIDATRRFSLVNENKIAYGIIPPNFPLEGISAFHLQCRITVCVRSHDVYSRHKHAKCIDLVLLSGLKLLPRSREA